MDPCEHRNTRDTARTGAHTRLRGEGLHLSITACASWQASEGPSPLAFGKPVSTRRASISSISHGKSGHARGHYAGVVVRFS